MFLSRLIISNYRSINELVLHFEKGKNVIVGKNNSGKSNIIKAIDLLLGENSPSWAKSENVTENDFYNGNIDKPIYIFCEIKREPSEDLNYEEIYKCFGYRYHSTQNIREWIPRQGSKSIPLKEPARHPLAGKSISEFVNSLDAAMNIDEDEVDTTYVNPKLKNQGTFEKEFDDKYIFAFAFRATFTSTGKIIKEVRFFYRENNTNPWIMGFSAPVRNEFLQSAIIHSFRDPQNELRINQWSWFGKLLKSSINSSDPQLISAFDQLKIASNGVFGPLQTEINNPRLKIAFPNTSISFQFNPDTRIDVYKSALIYVDDGFVSLLQEKGSGIQSAVIIGLFNYYTNKIAHSASSLLAIEEPEIYLHPQARRVISNRIDEYLQGAKNQVIITTHSTEFITSAHENLNIIVVRKTPMNGTEAMNARFDTSKEKQILVKSQNAEMFFADMVILVEGGEKYILESLASNYGKNLHPELGENWLNEFNISVIAVGGKSEFYKYVKKLKEMGIPTLVLADFDFFLRQLVEFFNELDYPQAVKDGLNAMRKNLGGYNKTELPRKIIELIEGFREDISDAGYQLENNAITKHLKEPFRKKRLLQFDESQVDLILSYLKNLRSKDIFILSGELEDFYTKKCKDKCRRVSGKEEKAIHIVSRLTSIHEPITEFINPIEYHLFLDMVYEKARHVNKKDNVESDDTDA